MTKEIRRISFDTDKESYEIGKGMLNTGMLLAFQHGAWDNELAKKVFGDGWLKDWETYPVVHEKDEQ